MTLKEWLIAWVNADEGEPETEWQRGYQAARDMVRVQLERADLELAEAAWKDSVEREHYKSTITANFIWNPIRDALEKPE